MLKTRPTQPGPGARALYLGGREHKRVSCTDEALVVTPQQWEATKRDYVYACQFTVHLPQALCSLCLAYVAAQLNSYGLTPQLWGPRLEAMDLDVDLCQLLWAEMNLSAGTLADKATEPATVTQLFERWSARNASALTLHLVHLHRTALKAMHT